MLKTIVRKGNLLDCGACLDARGLSVAELIEGAERSTMQTFSEHTLQADKVLVF